MQRARKEHPFIYFMLAMAVILAMLPAIALAGKPPATNGLALIQESRSGWPDDLDCYHEDDYHNRKWKGNIPAGKTFRVDLSFCAMPMGAGGTGILIAIDGGGSFDLRAESPSGVVYLAHDVAAQRSRTTSLRRCVVTDEYMINMIESGNWSVSLTNTGDREARDVTFQVYVAMAKTFWQETNCPAADWNFS